MHIVFLNSIEKETYGGMEEWIRLAASGLAGRGHRVTLIGRKDSYYLDRAAKPYDKIESLELDISGDFNPATIAKIKSYLDREAVDVITVNFNKDVRLGGLAARFNGQTKVVWSVGLNITKDKLIHKLLTPKLVDKVIVPSQSLKDEITSLGYIEKDITEVIPISIEDVTVDEDKIICRRKVRDKYALNDEAIIAVTSGRFVEQKGHDYLISAAVDIVKQIPNIRFLLLGDGPLKDFLENMIRENNLQSHFTFAGMLDDINNELNGADLMIHPSRFEPFGIAVLEGMRAGLPIVASRIGGIPEVVKEGYNAVLVEPGQPDKIAESVIDLISNREKMVTMGQNGRKRFEEDFQLNKMIDRLEQVYLSIAGGKVRKN